MGGLVAKKACTWYYCICLCFCHIILFLPQSASSCGGAGGNLLIECPLLPLPPLSWGHFLHAAAAGAADTMTYVPRNESIGGIWGDCIATTLADPLAPMRPSHRHVPDGGRRQWVGVVFLSTRMLP